MMLKLKKGASSTETGLIIGLIAVLLIGSLTATGEKVRDLFVNTENTLRGSAEGTTYIGPIPLQSIPSNDSLTNVNLKVNDTNEPLGTLDVSASSSNTDLLPNSAISIQFSKGKWLLSATPLANTSGETVITASATGDTNTATTTFTLAVLNQAPTVSASQNSFSLQEGQAGSLSLEVLDSDTAAGDLEVTATSSNTDIIPASGVSLSGGGNAYNLTITPADGGTATITVSVSDGTATTETTIDVTATAVYTSCLDLKTRQPSSTSGNYTIDPDGYNGSIATQSVYCDMTSDGGGYTMLPLSAGSVQTSPQIEAACQAVGLQMFVPRSPAHLLAAFNQYGAGRLYLMGVFPKASGNTCTNKGLNSNTCTTWGPNDGGHWYISTSTAIAEPNGDNTVGYSMYYAFNGSGVVTAYNDIRVGNSSNPNNYRTSTWLCSSPDEKNIAKTW